jgi:hypothetical protein
MPTSRDVTLSELVIWFNQGRRASHLVEDISFSEMAAITREMACRTMDLEIGNAHQ